MRKCPFILVVTLLLSVIFISSANAQLPTAGSITFVKDAVPNDPQSFGFSQFFGVSFSLVDDGTGSGKSISFFGLPPGTHQISELTPLPAGWNLTNIEIDDPDGGSSVDLETGTATIDFDAGEDITVTFTNTKECSISFQTAPIDTTIEMDGRVFDNGSEGKFLYGNQYTATAVVPDGYTFVKWMYSGNLVLSDTQTNPTDVTVLCGGSLTAGFRLLDRNVAATSQTASESSVVPGDPLEIYVTVENVGEATESFDVTCYYDGDEIDTLRVEDLAPGDSDIITFVWDTTGVPLNTYLIRAWADSGEEITEFDEDNNWCDMQLPILFVVPEYLLGTILGLTAFFTGFGAYYISKRKMGTRN